MTIHDRRLLTMGRQTVSNLSSINNFKILQQDIIIIFIIIIFVIIIIIIITVIILLLKEYLGIIKLKITYNYKLCHN